MEVAVTTDHDVWSRYTIRPGVFPRINFLGPRRYVPTRGDGLGNYRVWVEFWCRLSFYDCVDGLDG
jgi:hypothetical protein